MESESSRLEVTFEIIQSNCPPSTASVAPQDLKSEKVLSNI